MENQKDKKKKKVLMPFGLRNKLMAAISMLLVSSIMLVSSTYAWFTLSTAPEVKGISTSVGANGNLEMALLTSEGANTFENLDKITSAAGDSAKELNVKNLTWGNLVDLSYKANNTNNFYGLDKIQLMPARLNNEKADGNTNPNKLVLTSPLLTPTYGNDGRVKDITGNTLFSADFDKESNQGFKAGNVATYGVRAVGESGNMSAQEKGLRASKAAYTSNLNAAKNLVQASLETNMQNLFNAVLGLATQDGYVLKDNEVTAINNLLDGIAAGLDKIDLAYGDVLRAYAAHQLNAAEYEAAMKAIAVPAVEENEETGTAAKPAVTVANGTYTQIKDKLEENGASIPTTGAEAFTTAVRDLADMRTAVTTAKEHVTSKEYAAAVKCLVDTTKVKLNGLSLNKPENAGADSDYTNTVWTWKTDENGQNGKVSVDAVKLAKAGVVTNAIIDMQDDSGLFVGIADVTGNYSAIRNDVNINTDQLTLENTTVTMKTSSTKTNAVTDLIGGITANTNTTGVVTYITDTYGYIIDLAVRTNATDSNLLLASDGVQRVYTDASNTATMGAGSTMTFKSVMNGTTPILQDAQVAKLMTAIRVVFFDPDNGNIYGIAQLTGISSADGETTGKLALMNASVDDNGVMKLTAKEGTDADKLMALQQNTATKISVLVYLDGDTVDNSMVANDEQSVTGSLNLQFKSSAELKPMENSALKNGTNN